MYLAGNQKLVGLKNAVDSIMGRTLTFTSNHGVVHSILYGPPTPTRS